MLVVRIQKRDKGNQRNKLMCFLKIAIAFMSCLSFFKNEGRGNRGSRFWRNKRSRIHQSCLLKNACVASSLLPHQRIWIFSSDLSQFTKRILCECFEKNCNVDKILKTKRLSQNDSSICFTIFNLIKNYLIISRLYKNGSVPNIFYNHVVYYSSHKGPTPSRTTFSG